jgi:hypothetical protein
MNDESPFFRGVDATRVGMGLGVIAGVGNMSVVNSKLSSLDESCSGGVDIWEGT